MMAATDEQHALAMPNTRPKSFLERNGLTLAFVALFALSFGGHIAAGWLYSNEQHLEHQRSEQPLHEYLTSGEFWSSVLENWESEFLQMGLFVMLTVWLRQWGSAESRPFDPKQEAEQKKKVPKEQQPWPARRGGWWRRIYEYSLAIALLLLFVASFVAHWLNSWRQHIEEQQLHGEAHTRLIEYLFDAEFWFQSFQNWQSEFLAVAALVLLSIVLRQKDSPQSKQVEAPHTHTGH